MATAAASDLRRVAPEVHVLVPYAIEEGRAVSPEYDTDAFKAEVASWFAPLGLVSRWRAVTPSTLAETVADIALRGRERPVVAFNLCDGFDVDGYPGPSVLAALEAGRVPYTGAGANAYRTSSDKLAMKRLFRAAGVATAPWHELHVDADVAGVGPAVGFPAILKLSDSAAGDGLSRSSVVASEAEALAQFRRLVEGGYAHLRIFAEHFLAGREATVLVRDAPWEADGLATLPAVEMVYNARVPVNERILFVGHRYVDPDGRPREKGGGEARCTYAAAPADIRPALDAAARAAYRAMGADGYARVDLRFDPETGAVNALEVNANPELSRVAPTIEPALAAAGLSFEALIGDMLAAALGRGGVVAPSA